MTLNELMTQSKTRCKRDHICDFPLLWISPVFAESLFSIRWTRWPQTSCSVQEERRSQTSKRCVWAHWPNVDFTWRSRPRERAWPFYPCASSLRSVRLSRAHYLCSRRRFLARWCRRQWASVWQTQLNLDRIPDRLRCSVEKMDSGWTSPPPPARACRALRPAMEIWSVEVREREHNRLLWA